MAKPEYPIKRTTKTHRNIHQIKESRKSLTVTEDNQYIVYTKYDLVKKYKKDYFSICENLKQIHLKKAENNPQWYNVQRKIITTNPGEISPIEPDENIMSVVEYSDLSFSQENGGHTIEEDTDGESDSNNYDVSEEEPSVLISDSVAIQSTIDGGAVDSSFNDDVDMKYILFHKSPERSHLIDSGNDQRVLNRVIQEEERESESVADNTYHQHSFNVSCTLIIVGIVASIIFVIIRTKQMASFMKRLSLQTVNK